MRHFEWRGLPAVPGFPELLWGASFYDWDLTREIEISVTEQPDAVPETLTLAVLKDFRPPRAPIPSSVSAGTGSPEMIRTDLPTPPRTALRMSFSAGAPSREEWFQWLGPNGLESHGEPPTHTGKPVFYVNGRGRFSPQEEAQRLATLDVRRAITPVVKSLQCIEPSLEGLSLALVGLVPQIFADLQGSRAKVPVNLIGDGTGRLLSILLAMAATPRGVVLIDEIENGIHYSAFPAFWRAIASAAVENECQVIATTHSYECLRGAFKGLEAEFTQSFSYLRLDREKKDVSATTYPDEVLVSALEQGVEVR